MQSLLAKFAPALLPFIVLLLGGIQTMFADDVATPKEGWQFAALAAGAIVTFIVPLLKGGWSAGLKVLANVLAAVAVIFVDLIDNGTLNWDVATITFVVLGIIQAFGAQIGVDVRVDAQKQVIDSRITDGVPNITSVDKPALQVAAIKNGESDTMLGHAGV